MSDLAVDQAEILATYVVVGGDMLTVSLSDGRSLTLPLAWYPRLTDGTPAERNNWRLVGDGVGIHWPDLDEDLSVDSLLEGRKSAESSRSLKFWLDARKKGKKVTLEDFMKSLRKTSRTSKVR